MRVVAEARDHVAGCPGPAALPCSRTLMTFTAIVESFVVAAGAFAAICRDSYAVASLPKRPRWLVRSLDREDQLPQSKIARRMQRHPSWVWRRLMLVEALDPLVQTDVRLGLIAPRAAVAVSRLPRGNQHAASAVVVRRGLTFRQTEALVDDALGLTDPAAREALLVRRLDGPAITPPSGPRPSRAVRGEADWISADIVRVRDIAARLEARLLATPLEVFAPAAAELLRDELVRLSLVLRALDGVIAAVTRQAEAA